MDFRKLADLALSCKTLSHEQCQTVLACPDAQMLDLLAAVWRVRRHFCGLGVHVQVLANAKSGACGEDCRYCSQSKISKAGIEQYPMMETEKLVDEARRARRLRAKRFCMAMSGRGPTDREIDQLCEIIRRIKAETDLALCCSPGFLNPEQAHKLKAAGLDRVNHNLNTSERFHPKICTTHSYQDRLATLRICRQAGLELCSGGIVGQGESDEDIIDMCLTWAELRPESIPVNFLTPIEGTPFADRGGELTPQRCLKILCLVRLTNPDREIRIASGRELHLRSLQPLGLYAANSIFVTGYLTTPGQRADEAYQMIADLGLEIENDQENQNPAEATLETDQYGLPATVSARIAELGSPQSSK